MADVVDPFDLARFVAAQARVFDTVVRELAAGEKRSHWMWFVFPQIAGLGHSPTAQHYAIRSLEEAEAYLAHPVLGPRLRECTQLVVNIQGKSAEQIFHHLDALKFRSSMTLFARASEGRGVFDEALRKYFPHGRDERTLEILG